MMRKLNGLLDERKFDEAGMTTAELMGNTALAIIALASIWAALNLIGVDMITMMREKIFKENP